MAVMRPHEVHHVIYHNKVGKTLTNKRLWEKIGAGAAVTLVGVIALAMILLIVLFPYVQYWSDYYGNKGPAFARHRTPYAFRFWWTVGDSILGCGLGLWALSAWMKNATRWPWESVSAKIKRAVES